MVDLEITILGMGFTTNQQEIIGIRMVSIGISDTVVLPAYAYGTDMLALLWGIYTPKHLDALDS